MVGKKLIPFLYDYRPRTDHVIKLSDKLLKTIHSGDLLIEEDNPFIGIYFFPPFIKTDKGRLLVKEVFFDPTDNTMAIRIKGVFTIIDYEKCSQAQRT